ncbi:class I SAM-dependent methyltransferase [Fulvivirga lutea]|uniref:RsmD family RNA methyltransferase n=1 Tax=Fulvivirga lutea TaxID=2810512 RepID=A0A974WMP6_9BACT|nr:class I SAM-dependent methyltransferase [Fulvivirga lutea]QSE98283.1 RsmD family RNA methyltransferase [Fulvivirga lutea]
MIEGIINSKVQQFILENEYADPFELSLNHKEVEGVSIQLIAQQIAARKKAKSKLPTWYKTPQIIYPVKVSVEQSSSELTANYKATLGKGNSYIDLTAGMGVDTWALSQRFAKGICLEQNQELARQTEHNLKALGVANVVVIHTSAEDFLDGNTESFDLIYLDPARRDANARKVFTLEDCTPNIVELLPALKKHGNQILVKTAPLMDINLSIKSLHGVKEVHVVSVNNDCKEVLYLIDDHSNTEVKVVTVNLNGHAIEKFDFNLDKESELSVNYSPPKKYLFEPNASIMKAGGFKSIATYYNLDKLHANTHLYTSDKLAENFPGRTFQIDHLINYNKKEFHQLGIGNKANVATRNFKDSPEQIKKKLGVKDGGEIYLFAFTDISGKMKLAICSKVNKS